MATKTFELNSVEITVTSAELDALLGAKARELGLVDPSFVCNDVQIVPVNSNEYKLRLSDAREIV